MIHSSCENCLLQDRCKNIGLPLSDVRNLMFLVGFDPHDTFAMGMAEVTLKNRQGNLKIFHALLDETVVSKACIMDMQR